MNVVTPVLEALDMVQHIDEVMDNTAQTHDSIVSAHTTRYQYLRTVAAHFLGEMEKSRRIAGIELSEPPARRLASLTDPEAMIWRSQQ